MWTELDRVWMEIKYPIQIVHDIEDGYGDPLRTKIIPDFSLRFVDDSYSKQNTTIEAIKNDMVAYFSKRNSELSKSGIFALNNSFAAIYYIPFQCAMSLHFRFSGQSIPNRSEVKNSKGVKIYFDPISTDKRVQQATKLVAKSFADGNLVKRMDALDTIVYHVSAHEFGHAIYNLEAVKKIIKVESKSLLEEPRAELAAIRTMKLLFDFNKISSKQLQNTLASFALQDLRRFAMWGNSSTRPYTISAIYTYGIYKENGYIVLKDQKLLLNDDKALDVLTSLSKKFEDILDAMDALEGQKIEEILVNMQTECDIVQWLVKHLSQP